MANPTGTTGAPVVCAAPAIASPATLTLAATRKYEILHDGEDGTGTEATDTVYLTVDGSAPAKDEGAGRVKLPNRRAVLIGPGVSTLKYGAANAGVTFTVVPLPI